MLDELRIRNFAIIDTIELDFATGFNVITGETGAGKSIIIDAVELLLGSKADTDTVRSGAEKAVIEGVFTIKGMTRAYVLPILEREDLVDPNDSNMIVITRELRKNGRSSGRINGVTVSQEILQEVGEFLIDIHGQSAHLSLLKSATHIDLLDHYADLMEVREALEAIVTRLYDIREQIRQLVNDKETLEKRAEMLRYQIEEIDAAEFDPEEETDLGEERNRLANSEQLAKLAYEASVYLNGEDNDEQLSAVDQLMQVAQLLGKLASIDSSLEDNERIADELSAQAQELAIDIARYAEDVEYNPERLDEVEERLELINSLKRRHKVSSLAEVLEAVEKMRVELDNIDNSEERIIELRTKEEDFLKNIGELAQRLSNAREIAGEAIAKRIEEELKDLRMENTRFEVMMTQKEAQDGCYIGEKRFAFTTRGVDTVEFMMSANPGEPVRPLVKVASGGETARIMLALKRVLTQYDQTPILIFDEIDQGIGGRIGAVVGEKLWSLSDIHQVMVVTHLPQLASFGDIHYVVSKQTDGKKTKTDVRSLNNDQERVAELAEMLGTGTQSGKLNASEILQEARTRKAELRPDKVTAPTVQEKLL